jgi:hypothetical protein
MSAKTLIFPLEYAKHTIGLNTCKEKNALFCKKINRVF